MRDPLTAGEPTSTLLGDGRGCRLPNRSLGQRAPLLDHPRRRPAGKTVAAPDRHRVRTGRWSELRPGVWTPSGTAATARQDLAALTLSVPATASHLSSAWLHGELERPPGLHEITTSLDRGHHTRRARVHRTDDLARSDTQTVDGILCTNAIRTCIDLGARFDADELERFVERARHRRLIHMDPLIPRFLQLARPGRDGIATVRSVLQRLDPALEPAESDLETLRF